MTNIYTYLTFNGNCREAMLFYNECLDGELHFQTIGETPLAEKLPARMKGCILHATLTKGALKILASDMVGEQGLHQGNSVSLALLCSSEQEIKKYYHKLSAGGRRNHPLENSFWGAITGDITDKYGHHWVLNFERE